MKTTNDRYNGITIDPSTIPYSKEKFKQELHQLLSSVTNEKLLWIKVSIERSDLIPILTQEEFTFHHCDEKAVMLVKKLTTNPIIPTAKNYTVGVGAVVFDKGNLLVIKDKFQPGYKLPGGHIDNNEEIRTALKREVHEETGIEIAFESIINLGHFTHGQFGESNLYIVCTAKALSKEIQIHDSSEIVEARWISVETFLNAEETNNYNRSVVEAALNNSELKLQLQNVTLRIPIGFEVFF